MEEAAAPAAPSGGNNRQLSVTSANRFIREITTSEGQHMFQCTLCNMTTQFGNSMKRHMVIKHTKPSSHSCQYCQKVFTNKFYLNNHLASKTCMRNIMFDAVWSCLIMYNPWLLDIIISRYLIKKTQFLSHYNSSDRLVFIHLPLHKISRPFNCRKEGFDSFDMPFIFWNDFSNKIIWNWQK